MKYYAVIDTNVLVSAMLKWNSIPGNIMELVFDGLIIPIFIDKKRLLSHFATESSRPNLFNTLIVTV